MVRFSLGNFQFRAVGVNTRLAFRMAEGVADLFLEQRREQQQRIERDPCERGRLVGSAPDGDVQFRLCAVASKVSVSRRFLSRSNSSSCVARNGAGGVGRSSKRVSGLNLALNLFVVLFIYYFSFFSRFFGWLNKKPATALAIAGLENLCLNQLSFHSHDANKTGGGLPTGQTAVDGHMHLNLFGERRVHINQPQLTLFMGRCQRY
jgi:hypothetical protein